MRFFPTLFLRYASAPLLSNVSALQQRDLKPTASAHTLSGTEYASSSLRIFDNAPSSAVDIVVIFSQLAQYQKRQEDCCEELKAAKLLARILTLSYATQPPSSINNSALGLTRAEAAEVFCQSLCSERESSGKRHYPTIFTTAWDSVGSFTSRPG